VPTHNLLSDSGRLREPQVSAVLTMMPRLAKDHSCGGAQWNCVQLALVRAPSDPKHSKTAECAQADGRGDAITKGGDSDSGPQ
jgi:hypothetical protein